MTRQAPAVTRPATDTSRAVPLSPLPVQAACAYFNFYTGTVLRLFNMPFLLSRLGRAAGLNSD